MRLVAYLVGVTALCLSVFTAVSYDRVRHELPKAGHDAWTSRQEAARLHKDGLREFDDRDPAERAAIERAIASDQAEIVWSSAAARDSYLAVLCVVLWIGFAIALIYRPRPALL